MPSSRILVIGGAGYIGSHVCKVLSKKGFEPITFDNLSNGHEWAVKWGPLIKGNIHCQEDMDYAFDYYKPLAVIHLASSINVRESYQNPQLYYFNNFSGSLAVASAMIRHQVFSLVFSSSAAVYGSPKFTPIDENHPKIPLSPYGRTKSMAEDLFEDFHSAFGLNCLTFRYFNAAGADPDNEIGEAHEHETHLIPQLIATAQSLRSGLTIYGNAHPTPDGTAIRDYVHVNDLAEAHCLALEWLNDNPASLTLNLGSGKGYSVREVAAQVEKQSGRAIPLKYDKSNSCEPPILIADTTKARNYLGWEPLNSELEVLIKTAWNWHEQNVLTPSLSF